MPLNGPNLRLAVKTKGVGTLSYTLGDLLGDIVANLDLELRREPGFVLFALPALPSAGAHHEERATTHIPVTAFSQIDLFLVCI